MSTSIDQLLAGEGGGNNSMSDVDAILNELNSKQQQQQQQQQQPPKQITGPPDVDMRNNQMMKQLAEQQEQLSQLSHMNREKDMFIQQNIQNQGKKIDNTNVDLLTEFKSTIILFIVVTIFTLPILNNLITKSLGIENDNTIFAILKTFIMAIIFFLLNKFL